MLIKNLIYRKGEHGGSSCFFTLQEDSVFYVFQVTLTTDPTMTLGGLRLIHYLVN